MHLMPTDGRDVEYALVGGEVLDAERCALIQQDLYVKDGRVGEPRGPGSRVESIDVTGCVVVPGLVDMHAHAFHGTARRPHPDDVGIRRGATTIADAGSAGWTTFGAFRLVAESATTRLVCWLNLSSIGILDNRVPELMAQAWIDVPGAVACARENVGIVRGFKARLSTYAAGGDCMRVLNQLIAAGEAASLPVMVHVGDTASSLVDIVGHLRAGDVVTHCFTGGRNNAFDPATGEVLAGVREARDRGVLFDVGRGSIGHFVPELARSALASGFAPDIISSDVADRTALEPTFGVVSTVADLIDCGMDEVDAFLAASVTPAAVLGFAETASLRSRLPVDLTILERISGRDPDGWNRFRPKAVVRDGRFLQV